MKLLHKVKRHIADNELFDKQSKLLVTVSGGVDSVVMLNVLSELGFNLSIAHCNFKLRGVESDKDENFVRNLAMHMNLPIYVQEFDTEIYARNHKIGIQEAARNLRYAWFFELIDENGLDFINVAHNANDNTETVLFNLSRGAGLEGMRGIVAKNNRVVRPLLSCSREEIMIYADNHGLTFRNDSSNDSVKYSRNRIRHHVIPEMEKINPSLHTTILRNCGVAQKLTNFVEQCMKHEIEKLIVKQTPGCILTIDIGTLMHMENNTLVLYYILREFNYTYSDCQDVISCLKGEPGKIFEADGYKLLKDREYLFLKQLGNEVTIQEYHFTLDNYPDDWPAELKLELIETNNPLDILTPELSVAYVDADRISGSFILRKWQKGDRFKP
ncbi:MAG: tRNA lysidine(34) synthetase TilS, partial [Marinilabiliales bacterium]